MRRFRGVAILAALVVLGFLAHRGQSRDIDLSRYEVAVAEIQSSPEQTTLLERQYDCVIEAGPPLRIAFRRPGGIMDNWTAIVYDPTGLVLKARQFKDDWSSWDDPTLQEVKRLFGGDLRDAEPLGGPWYLCTFT